MKIIITQQADENLFSLYLYHLEYSEEYARTFQRELNIFIDLLVTNPFMGRVYNEAAGIYRVVFHKKYNIYYTIKSGTLYIVYILDGQVQFNTELLNPSFDLSDIQV